MCRQQTAHATPSVASVLSYSCEQGGMMMTFTHVLVPTDFSAPDEQALRYARAEAVVHHAKVTLLHVLPPHTGTEVYVVAGAPRAEVGFEPALEGRLGASNPTTAHRCAPGSR
jgi:hypothetical protein